MRAYFESAGGIFNQARRAIEDCDRNHGERSPGSLLENFREYRSRLSNQEFTVSHERLFLREPKQLASDPALVLRDLEFIGRHAVAPAADRSAGWKRRAGMPAPPGAPRGNRCGPR